jgi:hypothetical protein
MGLRGPKPKGAAHAMMKGYYRPSRHGPRPQPAEDPEEAWREQAWKTILRLPGGPPTSRPLDPIEQEMKDLGIVVLPEDRRPQSTGGVSDAGEPGSVRKDGREEGTQ